ncbi:unnamed protein product [Leptosia nina]|uniref:C2H2-type domain-containing protein n=1 Tax=Leptosia nina TaxID=320188 RepID=A0AAV1J0F9_9NEOP
MFSDEEIKDSGLARPDDELISIQEVCLVDKYDKKDFGFNSEPMLFNSGRSNLDVLRYFRDGFLESLEQQQAKFAWTEEDGNIASLVSSPAFGTGSTFSKELDALSCELKEADTSSNHEGDKKNNGLVFATKPADGNAVSSTSGGGTSNDQPKDKNTCKIDKEDPRSRLHFVKYIKRHGRAIKLWECGICSREFQHQYTLMRHLPTHTDERNYHCSECSKSFRQLSTLSQHRAIHSAERPYSCEVCKKTFNRVSTLISHRKIHSDEKPYRCHICPKGFHQKGSHPCTPYDSILHVHSFTPNSDEPKVAHPECGPFKETICIESVSVPTTSEPVETLAPNQARPPSDQCEVTSTMGPYMPPEISTKQHWETKPNVTDSLWGGGVIVDPIKTYHMGVAMATRQTPFALLQSDSGIPVLVKVVDTELPGGKQMLVPATAEDLRVGGKIVMKKETVALKDNPNIETVPKESAVQIRVPVVATVVPKIEPGGGLHLAVEEPHHAYHSALAPDSPIMSYSLLPPAPSPPLDFIPLDLFEPMECMPMGPQITAVNDDQPSTDDSDIFITKFEMPDTIHLSDSE